MKNDNLSNKKKQKKSRKKFFFPLKSDQNFFAMKVTLKWSKICTLKSDQIFFALKSDPKLVKNFCSKK
jgi:hypothetical protein